MTTDKPTFFSRHLDSPGMTIRLIRPQRITDKNLEIRDKAELLETEPILLRNRNNTNHRRRLHRSLQCASRQDLSRAGRNNQNIVGLQGQIRSLRSEDFL